MKKLEKYIVKVNKLVGLKGLEWKKGEYIYSNNIESLPYFKSLGLTENPNILEPVYKEEKQLPKINGYEGKYNNDRITYGCATFNKYWFEEILKLYDFVRNFEGIGTRHLKSIKLDSGVEITMEQVKEIVEYLKIKQIEQL